MSVSPDDWGPQYWRVMHSVAFWYPTDPTNDQKQSAHAFYSALRQLLPCAACRAHYEQILIVRPLDRAVQNRMSLVRWVIDVHNDVNESIGKSRLDFDEAVLRVQLASESSHLLRTHGCDWQLFGIAALVGAACGALAMTYLAPDRHV